jgi:aminoglycoside phosphotransferase (APT) family kinase protein
MPTVARLVDVGAATSQTAHEIRRLLEELAPYVLMTRDERDFVHNDLHEMNVMCTRAGGLLALLDWGDAGWGDPAVDFVGVPLQMMAAAFEGYGVMNRMRLGSCPEARIVWAKLHDAMDDAINQPGKAIPLSTFRRYLDHQVTPS